MFEKLKFYILLHVIIFMWGFTGILGKLILLDSLLIVWWRVLIAFVGLFIAMKIMKKKTSLPSKKRLFQIMGVGVLVAMHWLTFYKSIQLSTASLGILCLSTVTLHVTWLEPIVMKRKFSLLEFGLGLIVIYGIYFVSGDFKAKDYEALAYGLSSAVFAALFSVFNAKLVQDTSAYQITLYEMITAFVFMSFVLLFVGKLDAQVFVMTWSDFAWLLFLGLACTSFAFLTTVEVVKHLGAFTVSLSINLEPVYTIILAIFILQENEILGSQFYIGSVLIIAVVVLNAIIKRILRTKAQRKAARLDGTIKLG